MPNPLPYRLFDADNHYYEPRDAFTRHIEARYRDQAVHVVETDGKDAIFVGDRPFTFLAPYYRSVAAPGSLREMLKTMSKSGSIAETARDHPIQPEYVDRSARLAVMDEQGVESCLMLPSLGVCIEHCMKRDVGQTYANLRAFNRWLEEDWGFGTDGRIYGVPLLSLLDIDEAVTELERVRDAGARVVHLRPGPVAGRSPADPVFDPFWARAEEAGITVAFHISESGYNELFSTAWGEQANPTSHQQSAFQWTFFYGDRPIMETIGALILHNLFGRFPGLEVLSVENGSLWVPYVLKAMDKMKGMGRNGPWLGGRVEGRPSEIFRRHVTVSPYHEEDLAALVDLIGPERVVLGSDYPHPEGLKNPADFADGLTSLDAADIAKIMRHNGRRIVALPA
jgi:predicted TIM-barrel fold metal-dependent hydrolase